MTFDTEKLLDETGWRILHELQENARISFSVLGQRVGLSAPAIAERVRRMEDAGIIKGYRAEINTAKVGYPITAIIRVGSMSGRCSRMTASAEQISEVLECYRITGSDCLIMKVMASSVEHLEAIIDRLSEYGEVMTSIVLSTPVASRTILPLSDATISARVEEIA